MKIAIDRVNIDPNGYRVFLPGYPREQLSQGTHDQPESVLLLLEVNEDRLLFVSLDVAVVTKNKADLIKQALSQAVLIPEKKIFVQATHTHSGPSGFDTIITTTMPTDSEEYFRSTINQLVVCSQSLAERLEPVTLQIGSTHSHGYYNNRANPTKDYNERITMINFINKAGNIIGGLLNVNVHSTVIGPDNVFITKDLLGGLREQILREKGILYYTFAGASADVSNRNLRQGNDYTELARVVTGIVEQIYDIKTFKQLKLEAVKQEQIYYKLDYDNTCYYPAYRSEASRIKLQLAEPEKYSYDEIKLQKSKLSILETKLSLPNVQIELEIQKLDFGELILITFPGELSSKLGKLVIDSYLPEECLILGYTNDFQMYFMEAEMYGETYETFASYVPKGEPEIIAERMSK